MKRLQALYDSEINFRIDGFWDGGFTCCLGDELNGFHPSWVVETIEEAIDGLVTDAIQKYPNSKFAKDRG